ncbi:hypothetical protein HPP92_028829 [Vanilla planifolia]|uniref:Uncharacterized protein n=1 Tax=Vanilla planifolia TaxID=51239 RepID=A0A835P4E9_VANPL|nr:hypothetical protein HPP92_028829 [Vanilla planifolia]KAG0446465.1 hypothetical protein HPP92_028818 [Vanilla planifolia]
MLWLHGAGRRHQLQNAQQGMESVYHSQKTFGGTGTINLTKPVSHADLRPTASNRDLLLRRITTLFCLPEDKASPASPYFNWGCCHQSSPHFIRVSCRHQGFTPHRWYESKRFQLVEGKALLSAVLQGLLRWSPGGHPPYPDLQSRRRPAEATVGLCIEMGTVGMPDSHHDD